MRPRSSEALTVSLDGVLALRLALAPGATQAISGGRSSKAPPGVATVETASQVGETVSTRVGLDGVGAAVADDRVRGAVAGVEGVVERAALEDVAAVAAGDVAAAVGDREAVGAAVADERGDAGRTRTR